ncbi:F0F1 ATP synthase subunit B [Acidiluteibacter ferrifornacis]|uniref:ATP synthase subunit b n=1 Tax=Acidiluteibacter ferrifornacis TaxID=2692424 RepID=A0A6N9NGP0_9FLAO|nr:F0F1 ATP synthase subunit B [Acidiluteibacter ferrifornacis]MBR9833567.1 F0F1 ATP synthase subunit B [bacterium]NBG65063.1 F0F1 ATP synthase subunit B [Acidiluteibacter ferrifornacis]
MLSVSFGTVIWTTIAFLVVVFVLGKFAWPSILKSIKEREDSIEHALKDAEKAKEQMRQLKEGNEKLMAETRQERDNLLKDAREVKENIIAEAKEKAIVEAEKVMAASREAIRNEKAAAIAEIKTQVAELSVLVAEKILKAELSSKDQQNAFVEEAMKNAKLN